MVGVILADRLKLGALLANQEFRAVLASLYASPFYRWRFSGHAPDRLTVAPQDLRTADPTIAADIYSGRYAFAGAVVETGGRSPFRLAPPSQEWHRDLHGFGWLRHLRAADSELSRIHARAMVEDWISDFGRWNAAAWEPEIVARRLISWLSHSPLVLTGADHGFYRRFMRSLSRQARYLYRAGSETREGAPRLLAAIALAYAGLCMAGRARLLRQSARWLDEELERQILGDGGHISRNPAVLVELLLDLLPLRQTFVVCDVPPSRALISGIDRMVPMLRFFRHGDGTLAHFNGMGPTYADRLATILAYDDARAAPLSRAPHSGYQRLEAGEAVVIMDSGAPPPPLVSREAHAGCLSFEFSSGGSRIIVNCGASAYGDASWRIVARSTAAHSTATIEDTSSCHFAAVPWITRRLGAIIMAGPRTVSVERFDDPGPRVAAGHDGYARDFGIVHERQIALAVDGSRLDGEDVFRASGGGSTKDPTFAIRFHLHPTARASRTRDGGRVIVAGAGGEAWEFEADGGEIAIEESVYLGAVDGPRRSEQVVLHGRCRHDPRVTWRFTRVSAASQRARRSSVEDEPALDLDE